MDPIDPESDEDILYLDNDPDDFEPPYEEQTTDDFVLDADGTLISRSMVNDISVCSGTKISESSLTDEDIAIFSSFIGNFDPSAYVHTHDPFESFVSDLKSSAKLKQSNKRIRQGEGELSDLKFNVLLPEVRVHIFKHMSLQTLMNMRATCKEYLGLIENMIEYDKTDISFDTFDEYLVLFTDISPKPESRKDFNDYKPKHKPHWHYHLSKQCIAYINRLRQHIKTVIYSSNGDYKCKSNLIHGKTLSKNTVWDYWSERKYSICEPTIDRQYVSTLTINLSVNGQSDLDFLKPVLHLFKTVYLFCCFSKSKCVAGMYCEKNKIKEYIKKKRWVIDPETRLGYAKDLKFVHND